ncbi:MAG: response regulator [Bacteroidetes bacterium]|nr:response regulator [Bacteroidota bacterium]
MNQIFTIYSIFFLATALVSFFVAFLAWQRRFVKGAKELSRVMIAAGVWAFWLIFETAATTVTEKIFWAKLEYFGAVSTPVLYLIFVLRFTGKDKFISLKNILALFIIPLITLALTITNEKHYLVWSGFSAISEKTNLMEYYHGIWFWVGYMGYNNVLLLLATIFLFNFIIHQTRTFRSQGLIVFIGGLCPWIASMVYLAGGNFATGLDLTPVSIILSGALLVYAILYFRFLDLAPVARETLVETLPDGILALDGQNRIQDINQAALALFGIRNKNIIGSQAESSGASETPLLNAAINLETIDQLDFLGSNGPKSFRILKQTIKSQPGSRLIVIRDITDYVARQKEIRDAEERYRKMFTIFRLMADNMPDMLWAKDLDKKFIFVNKSVCENLVQATDTDEPIGKNDMFFAERQRRKYPDRADWYTFGELCQDSDQVVISSGKPEHFDEFGNVNGKFLFLDVKKAPIINENGVMIGVVGSARDVTLQKKTESEMFKKDKLLDAIAKATAMLVQGDNLEESINGALEIIGKATEVNRVYIFRNHDEPGYKMPLMSQHYEWTDGSVESQIDWQELQNLPYQNDFPRWFEVLSVGKVIVGKVRDFPESEKAILDPQGIKSILVTPVIIDKNFWGFIGFDECNTERDWTLTEERLLSAAANTIGAAYLRKKNQDELIAAKVRAEESDRLKSAFLATMSHEIRTPMNGILGFISLLQEPDLTGEEKDEYVQIVKKSGDRLLTTIHDIIDISKIESGQMPVSLTDVNINEIAMILHSFFKREAEAKGLQLLFTGSMPENQSTIKSDRDKLNSILTNLIKNAIKFTHKGCVEFGYSRQGEFIEFYVKDTGIGIPEYQRHAIFERFVQANISHSRLYEGSGLGLAITKAYIEMLGGKIWIESVEGHGSTFYFLIPYTNLTKTAESYSPASPVPPKSDQRPLKILITEDDQVNYYFLRVILTKAGHTLIHTVTGGEAVEICRKNSDIDLVIMDIRLPDMDGYEATREIRKFNSDIPIIALTAYAIEGDREKALDAGCNDYLSKPVKKDTLIATLNKHTNKPDRF